MCASVWDNAREIKRREGGRVGGRKRERETKTDRDRDRDRARQSGTERQTLRQTAEREGFQEPRILWKKKKQMGR